MNNSTPFTCATFLIGHCSGIAALYTNSTIKPLRHASQTNSWHEEKSFGQTTNARKCYNTIFRYDHVYNAPAVEYDHMYTAPTGAAVHMPLRSNRLLLLRYVHSNYHHTCIKRRNEWIKYVSQITLTTHYFCSTSDSSKNREIEEEENRSVRCLGENLPTWSWPCCTQSSAHATTVAVIVVAGATTARSLPLHHHHRLQPCHTLVR
jgi:hypothetical protein